MYSNGRKLCPKERSHTRIRTKKDRLFRTRPMFIFSSNNNIQKCFKNEQRRVRSSFVAFYTLLTIVSWGLKHPQPSPVEPSLAPPPPSTGLTQPNLPQGLIHEYFLYLQRTFISPFMTTFYENRKLGNDHSQIYIFRWTAMTERERERERKWRPYLAKLATLLLLPLCKVLHEFDCSAKLFSLCSINFSPLRSPIKCPMPGLEP